VRIFVGLDYFGAGNMGDDLMLAGFLRALSVSAPDAEITICTPHDLTGARRRFPSVRWLANDEPTREAAARAADVWLGLGDTPFQLESGAWVLDQVERERARCERLALPMAFLGAGCESAAAADDARARHILAAAQRLWARDAFSAELLAAHAPRGTVETGADLAHAYVGSVAPPALEPGVLGLLLAFERAATVDMRAVDAVVAARTPQTTRWLVQEARSFPFTERYLYAALPEATRAGVSLTALDYDHDALATYLAAYGAPETVVSSRYHGTLVAAWHGARVAVIARSGKLAGAAAELHLPTLDCVPDARALDGLIERAHAVDPARLQALHERALAMCEAFVAWARAMAEGRLHVSRTIEDAACEVPRTVNETLATPSPASSGVPLWDERELEHIRQAIFRAPLRTEPSEHEYVEGFFSERVYAEILRQFPSDDQAFRRWRNPGDSAVRFANYSQRQEIAIPDDADRLTAEQRDFWLAMWNLVCGPAFARVLFARFSDYVRRRFGEGVDDPSFIDERVRGTMILNQHDADYFLGPHTDRGEKLFTCVFYFPEHEGLEHLGTTLYEPLEAGFTCPGTAHHDPARFRRGETMPYRANSALVFARTDVMFHGVHALTAAELGGSRRRGIQMQFYVRNERRPEECKITLEVPMPEQMRAGTGDSVAYRLTNRAAVELASSAPYTTQLGYRWFDAQGRPVEAESGVGTELPGVLAPGEMRAGFVRIVAPREPGRYQLRVSAVQANVAWFDDLDPANGAVGWVTVWDPSSAERAAEEALTAAGEARREAPVDIVSERDDLVLGAGWYPVEHADGQTFRWVANDAVVYVAALRAVTHRLTVVVEPGPGVRGRPFDLTARLADGRQLGTVRVAGKQPATFTLPPESPSAFAITLRASGGGTFAVGDPRLLNFRVFAVDLERTADVLPAWAVPEAGFQPIEHHAGSVFRWVGGPAHIAIREGHGAVLAFDVEPGPGVGSAPFTLRVAGDAGTTIASIVIAARTTVRIPLDALGTSTHLVLQTDQGGRVVADDPRVLDYRVFLSDPTQ
jgi:hypothetical protein